jgi:hypothetical protein
MRKPAAIGVPVPVVRGDNGCASAARKFGADEVSRRNDLPDR